MNMGFFPFLYWPFIKKLKKKKETAINKIAKAIKGVGFSGCKGIFVG